MGGSPSVPAPPPPPDPVNAAKANELYYRSSMETYVANQGDIAALEQRLREQYNPRQRELERQMSALDTQRAAQTGLQVEREYGPQRSLEALRRQYEIDPNAFAVQRGLGKQASAQYARLYGQSPESSVPYEVTRPSATKEANYLTGLSQ